MGFGAGHSARAARGRGWPLSNLRAESTPQTPHAKSQPRSREELRRRAGTSERGAAESSPPRRRRRRPALSRVLNLPLPRLPPLPRLGGGRAARRAPSGLQAAGQHDLPLPCECQCPGEGKPPGKSMSPEQERTEITAIRALPSLFSSNDFCPFPFRAPFLQQGPALPETSFPFLAYDHSLDVKETERH